MKKLYLVLACTFLLLNGCFIHLETVNARPFNPVRRQKNIIHNNILQSLRPEFKINSRYSVPVTSVNVSSDGKNMVMHGEDNRVHLWNLSTGQKIYSFTAAAGVVTIGFLSRHELLVSDRRGVVTIVNFNGKRAWSGPILEIKHPVHILALHPRLKIMALAGADNFIELWQINPETGLQKINSFNPAGSLVKLAFSGDGRQLVNVNDKGLIQAWDWRKGNVIFSGEAGFNVSLLAVLPESSLMAAGSKAGRVCTMDFTQNNPFSNLSSTSGYSKSNLAGLTFSGSKTPYLLACNQGGEIYKWEIPSGKLSTSPVLEKSGKLNDIDAIPGQKYFLLASRDHTVKLCSFPSDKVLAQLIVMKDGWGVLAANGCFDGTLNETSEDYLGALSWSFNKRKFALDGFVARYYQPALLGHLLQGQTLLPVDDAPIIAEQHEGFPLPPQIEIVRPAQDLKTSARKIEITLKVTDQKFGIKDIRLYHNGNIISDKDAVTVPGKKSGTVLKKYQVSLISGINAFKAIARNDDLIESEADFVTVKTDWSGPRPRLHVLAVGISKYDNQHLDLHYARRDAEEIGKILLEKRDSVYSEIVFHHLYDSAAKRVAIDAQLAELAQLPPQDAVIIYLAGHGETLADEWFFIPYEVRHPENANWLKKSAISSSLLEMYIAGIGARRIFLVLDACKSGAVVDIFADFENHRSMALLSRLAGIHVFSASTKNQYAGEFGRLGHGLFTYSMLMGLKGAADCKPADGKVTVSEIMSYVESQMPVLIKNFALPEQQPLANSHGEDFPVIGISKTGI